MSSLFFISQFFYYVVKGNKLLFLDKVKLLDEVDEVFQRCIQMCFLLQLKNVLKVLVVDVSVDAEKSLQNGACNREEVFRKWNTLEKNKNANDELKNHRRQHLNATEQSSQCQIKFTKINCHTGALSFKGLNTLYR